MLVGGTVAGTVLALGALPGATAETTSAEGLDGSTDGQTRDYGFLPPRPADERHVRPMMFPVLGPVRWSDTYLFPRGGGRVHEGQDLMAAKMQKLLAVASGTIVELRHGSSGNSLYLKGDDGWYYCYLHINNDRPGTDDGSNIFANAFAPGLATGSRVTKGQHLAFVGDSGNAESTAPHCHFEIRMPNERWYNAAAVNAKYSLDAAEAAREGGEVPPEGGGVPPETFTPWRSSTPLIERQYSDFLGRAPGAGLTWWGPQLDRGQQTPQWLMQYLLASEECDAKTHAVARLFRGAFGRLPDFGGFWYWAGQRRRGMALSDIAAHFAASSEFKTRYGSLTNRAFVDRVYRNVLGRAPDSAGWDHWTAELDRGLSRGNVLVHFTDSTEHRTQQRWTMHVVATYGCMLRRMPTGSDLSAWVEPLAQGRIRLEDMVHFIRQSGEYAWIVAGTA